MGRRHVALSEVHTAERSPPDRPGHAVDREAAHGADKPQAEAQAFCQLGFVVAGLRLFVQQLQVV